MTDPNQQTPSGDESRDVEVSDVRSVSTSAVVPTATTISRQSWYRWASVGVLVFAGVLCAAFWLLIVPSEIDTRTSGAPTVVTTATGERATSAPAVTSAQGAASVGTDEYVPQTLTSTTSPVAPVTPVFDDRTPPLPVAAPSQDDTALPQAVVEPAPVPPLESTSSAAEPPLSIGNLAWLTVRLREEPRTFLLTNALGRSTGARMFPFCELAGEAQDTAVEVWCAEQGEACTSDSERQEVVDTFCAGPALRESDVSNSSYDGFGPTIQFAPNESGSPYHVTIEVFAPTYLALAVENMEGGDAGTSVGVPMGEKSVATFPIVIVDGSVLEVRRVVVDLFGDGTQMYELSHVYEDVPQRLDMAMALVERAALAQGDREAILEVIEQLRVREGDADVRSLLEPMHDLDAAALPYVHILEGIFAE